MKTNLSVRYRIPMLMAGFLSLLFGMYIGLVRLGWNFPLSSANQFSLHGPLMVCGFLGTVISLERAVAIGERWAYLAPFTAAAGALVLITGVSPSIGIVLITMASLLLCIVSVKVFLKQRELLHLRCCWQPAAGLHAACCGWQVSACRRSSLGGWVF